MKYSLSDRRMAESMIINEVLFGQGPSFLDEMGMTLKADLFDCHVCLTGIPQKVYREVLNKDLGAFLELYDEFRSGAFEELEALGVAADMALVKFDRTKRICCILTLPQGEGPGEGPGIEGIAERLHGRLAGLYERRWGITDADCVFLTALSGHLTDPNQLHAGFEEARGLAKLAFFTERSEVMTTALYEQRHRAFDLRALEGRLREIELCLIRGDCGRLDEVLDTLFCEDLRASFCFQMSDYALAGISRLVARYNDVFIARIDPARYVDLSTRGRASIDAIHREARSVLLDCARASRKTGLEVGPVTLEVVRYLRAHYAEPFTVRGLAQQVGVSPNYLSRMFNDEVGESIPEYVTKVRLEHARRLLESTDESVTTISERVGFGSAKYFAQVFRRATGLTPTRYREQARSKGAARGQAGSQPDVGERGPDLSSSAG